MKIMHSNTAKQIKTAIVLGIFLLSIQLQKGKNKVAKMPPIHSGIRNPFAKYNPKKVKNRASNFLITDDDDTIMIP
jgi:hypothetical protein